MGEWRYSSAFLDLALGGDAWSASGPCRFTPGERAPPRIYWIGGWVGPKISLDAVKRIEPGAVQPVACRYTD
jgi:hypothetical protein